MDKIDLYAIVFVIYRFILLLKCFYFFGYLKGLLLYPIPIFLVSYLMKLFLGKDQLSSFDNLFILLSRSTPCNLGGILYLETMNKEKIKDILIARTHQFRRLRQRLVFKCLSFFWDTPCEDDSWHSQIQILNDKEFENDEEVNQFITSQAFTPFKLNEYFWKIYLFNLKGKESGGIIFFFDHALSDGLGAFSLFLVASDNYNIDMFPKYVSKKIPFWYKLLCLLTFPYNSIKIIEELLFTMGEKNVGAPIKLTSKKEPIALNISSKPISFQDLISICKEQKVSFNDMIVSGFSAAINKHLIDKGIKDAGSFTIMNAVTYRGIPEHTSEFQLENLSTVIPVNIDLCKDALSGCHSISKSLKKVLHSTQGLSFLYFGDIFNLYLPILTYLLIRLGALTKSQKLVLSNVPGPKEPIYIGGSKVYKVYPIPTNSLFSVFVGIATYCGEIKLSMSTQKGYDVDLPKFMSNFEGEFQNLINSKKNN